MNNKRSIAAILVLGAALTLGSAVTPAEAATTRLTAYEAIEVAVFVAPMQDLPIMPQRCRPTVKPNVRVCLYGNGARLRIRESLNGSGYMAWRTDSHPMFPLG